MDDAEFQLTTDIAEFLRTRHFGKYRGLVQDINDPKKSGRIKATVPAVFGTETSPWAMPCVPFAGNKHGLVLLPEVGDGVWIEFEGGDPSVPIWSGCWWQEDTMPEPKGETFRLLATKAGHQIVIDEKADEIRLEHPKGAKLVIGASEISLSLGRASVKLSSTEVTTNEGMVKVTMAGASLVNDAFKIGG